MLGLSIKELIPKSFTTKNGLIVLSDHIAKHPNVMHPVNRYTLKVNVKAKIFDVIVYHPGTKDPTYSNDLFENGRYYPVKYELPGHGHAYSFPEGKVLLNLIQALVEKDLKTKDTVDYLVVDYDESKTVIPCMVYMTQADGKKTSIQHIIQ